MGINRGKQFESVFKECCEKVDGVSIDRLHDQTNGFAGSSNICDYIVYKKPYEYYIECKTTHSNTLSIHSNNPKKKYGNISNKQFEGLLEKSPITGVFAGVIIWFIDKDVTVYIPIQELARLRTQGHKSVHYTLKDVDNYVLLDGKKKRVFFDYFMQDFFDSIEEREDDD